MNFVRDFTPTKEQISLHGLGFIQVILPGKQRLHVWHPDLPRRKCYPYSAVHNHRFAFESRVLVGLQVNRRFVVMPGKGETHDIISHDGPRSPKGGRLSYISGQCSVVMGPVEYYRPGETYRMDEFEYHETPNTGVVVTLMTKLSESTEGHANSIIDRGQTFDQDFDRFQIAPERLWSIVTASLQASST